MLKGKLGIWILGIVTLLGGSGLEGAGNLTPRGSDHASI